MRQPFNAYLYSLAVVRDDDRYLLVEEVDDGKKDWYLPAGGVEPGEDFHAAAIRETREESGIIIEPLGILAADQSIAQDGRTTKIRMILLAKPTGGTLKSKPDKESLRSAWFTPTQIPQLPLRHHEVSIWITIAENLRQRPLPQLTCHKPHLL